MEKSKIIEEIENTILTWEETTLGKGDFGAITFLYRGKEFGHIHSDGVLDISFDKSMTTELRRTNLVETHQFVPETNITYRVSNEAKVVFAVALLRLAYLIHFIKSNEIDNTAKTTFETELAKLPESLSSIYWMQK